ncbi:MAG: sigma-70 family RNA polymerase sigma factor [Flavobacteriales bacterium]|nr:sigma-70 family RNA polymerase sigma factor [Flavobacteriales bacterium]
MAKREHPEQVGPLVENLFRRESGRLTAAITRFFGSAHLELAEDVVQDTLLKAMREWPFKGIPHDPVAWLHRVAKNGAIDRLRHDARGMELLKENAPLLRSEWSLALTVNEELREETITDDQLRMFFACCHPGMPAEQQIALVLKTLCGFSVAEIARAFVTNEEAINKRLYRAREAFRGSGRLEIPGAEALGGRMERVLSSIYLLFNEGYNSTGHEDLIREDLIEEALRLCDLLTQNPATDLPEVHALLALMLFHAARNEARTGADGGIILLPEQDRTKWDLALIALAGRHLDIATRDGGFTSYQVEAAIAGLHANARTFAATNWAGIVALYDQLLLLKPTDIVRMNRAIAIGRLRGAAEGLKTLREVTGLENNHIYQAAMGELRAATGDVEGARRSFHAAIASAPSPKERGLIEKKLNATPGV